MADDNLGQVRSGDAGEAVSRVDASETDAAPQAHLANASQQTAKPSIDLVHERPSRLLIIWRLLKRRPRLSIYGALASLVLAVALFVVVISEPARPVIMATPQPLAKTDTAAYRDTRASQATPLPTDSADDWRRATMSEPPAAGGEQLGAAAGQIPPILALGAPTKCSLPVTLIVPTPTR